MQRRFTGSLPEASLVVGTGAGVELGADVAVGDSAVSGSVCYPEDFGEGQEG